MEFENSPKKDQMRECDEEERLYFMNLFTCDFQLISFDVSPRSNRVFHSRASSSAELFASTCLFFTSREMKVDGGMKECVITRLLIAIQHPRYHQ